MKTYEAMFLLDNREVKKGWEPLKESVDSILTKRGAEIVVAKRWDERKLAYEIKKQRRATFYLSYLKADPSAIDEIRRDLELTVPVLRYLILSCDAIPEDAYEPEREFTMVEDDSDATQAKESSGGEEGAEAAEGADATEGAKAEEGEATTEVVAEAAAPEAADSSAPASASEPAASEPAASEPAAPAEAEKPEENKE